MIDVNTANAAEAARVLAAFLDPFDKSEIKKKPAMVKGNRCLVLFYIDARCVLERLDEVVGMANWRDEYTLLPQGSVECRLSVRIAGEWITKADVGSESEQPDGGDRMKAAYSDALKRAAVKFGIGRFLYRMPQQWMDYDPVKKRIVDDAPAPQPRPTAPKPAAVPLKPPARDNLALRAKRSGEVGSLKDRAACDALAATIKHDAETGTLSPADLDILRPMLKQAYDRFPK